MAQAATLISGGLLIVVSVIIETALRVPGWHLQAAAALMALTGVVVICGLVAPHVEFSPIMRRWTEIAEYAAVVLVLPLAAWIIGLYAYLRGLRL